MSDLLATYEQLECFKRRACRVHVHRIVRVAVVWVGVESVVVSVVWLMLRPRDAALGLLIVATHKETCMRAVIM